MKRFDPGNFLFRHCFHLEHALVPTSMFKKVNPRLWTALDMAGLVFLCAYLFTHPTKLNPAGIVAFLVVHLGCSIFFTIVFYRRLKRFVGTNETDTDTVQVNRVKQTEEIIR